MVNTTSQALAVGNTITAGYGGLCLAFVSHCYGASAQYASAIDCWNGQGAHNVATNNITDVPVGAPIFFSQAGNLYGHVALYAGDGMMRTTYSPDNRIHTMSIALWISWGYVFLGYSKAIENQLIPDLNTTITTPTTTNGDTDMQAIIQPNDENRLVYFDGTKIHNLSHPDQVTALQQVAKQCGTTLPVFKMGSKQAPWFTRLQQALN